MGYGDEKKERGVDLETVGDSSRAVSYEDSLKAYFDAMEERDGIPEQYLDDEDPEWFVKLDQKTQEQLLENIDLGAQAQALAGQIANLEKIQGEIKYNPAARKQIAELIRQARELSAVTFRKISERFGSNHGGWYENPETRERCYVKFYENPDQARIEALTNGIYKKLGIRTVESRLLTIDGQLAIASKDIEPKKGARLSAVELRGSPEVANGFVADAYLGNWDVVGLVFDNIVASQNGGLYRVDNGGSMVFRARGGTKEFPADRVDELENMRNPAYPAGQVFSGISEDQIRVQVRALLERLRESDIDELVDGSGLQGRAMESIRASLKGRREFLARKYSVEMPAEATEKLVISEEDRPTIERAAERFRGIFSELERQRDSALELGMDARVSILADAGHIENQEIEVFDDVDAKEYRVNFKLTEKYYRQLRGTFLKMQAQNQVRTGEIFYGGHSFTRAWVVRKNGLNIRFATAHNIDDSDDAIQAALGLVQIDIPYSASRDVLQMTAQIQQILTQDLDVPEGLNEPEAAAERAYKQARYRWHHKTVDAPTDIDERLVRQEVFPGYQTIVEPGKHREYQAMSPYAVYHSVRSVEGLVTIIRAGGLLATHERYQRGLMAEGTSSREDLHTGGADSVFTRILTDDAIDQNEDSRMNHKIESQITLLFENDLLDRTDWYAYEHDLYGSTRPDQFSQRLTPEEIFEKSNTSRKPYNPSNEQMFRFGIPMTKVKAIVCRSEEGRKEIIGSLHKAGITTINGRSIEDIVIAAKVYPDLVDISNERQWRSKSPKELIRQEFTSKVKATCNELYKFYWSLNPISRAMNDSVRNLSDAEKDVILSNAQNLLQGVRVLFESGLTVNMVQEAAKYQALHLLLKQRVTGALDCVRSMLPAYNALSDKQKSEASESIGLIQQIEAKGASFLEILNRSGE